MKEQYDEITLEQIPRPLKAVFKAAYKRYSKDLERTIKFCNDNYRHQLTKEQAEMILKEGE